MSKEKLLLVGAGGFGRVVSELARQRYDCAFVDDGVQTGTEICDIPVVGCMNDLPKLFAEYKNLIAPIGNGAARARIYARAREIGYQCPNLISPSAYTSSYASLGWGCIILNNALVQNGASVGNGVLINPGAEIHQDGAVGDFSLIYTNSVVRTYAKVGQYARIGSNVTICNNAVVPDGAEIPDCTAVHPEVRK